MKKVDKGLSFFAALFVVGCILSIAVINEAHRVGVLINSVGDDGRAICALTGNERTRTYPVIAGKITVMNAVNEQEYHCAPGKLYWVAK